MIDADKHVSTKDFQDHLDTSKEVTVDIPGHHIRILDTGIDVSGVLTQLQQYPDDWGSQQNILNTGDVIRDLNFPKIEATTLQLVMGAISEPGQYVGDSELCVPTPAFYRHTEILRILGGYFRDISRCAFIRLGVGKNVGAHIDRGDYYLTRDRYHLSIQGKYKYFVEDEHVVVEPGMLLWFNNKRLHGTENLGDVPRITFVFDVKNPEYKL
jgi:hypothetical protein